MVKRYRRFKMYTGQKMFTKNQVTLQTFLANNLVPKKSISFATSIANRDGASAKQLYWVDKLVNDLVAPKQASAAPVPSLFDTSKIFKLFDSSRDHLKYPKINLKTAGGRPLRLSSSKKWKDTVFLAAAGFGSESYGRLDRGQSIRWYTKDDAVRADVEAMVIAFAADPVKVSADYGKLNHNCCFCSKGLDDQQSLDVGYGPICAQHYDLPWGGKSTPRTKPNVKELVEMPDNVFSVSAVLDQEMNELLVDF